MKYGQWNFMAIPETKLDTWSHQGSITQSSNTYNSVKKILEDNSKSFEKEPYDIYLQGSYANNTNIYSDSDVDIVIVSSVFGYDTSRLSTSEESNFQSAYKDASYNYADFKKDVTNVLSSKYGLDYSIGNKSINIAKNGNRRHCDVLIAQKYRKYYEFNEINDESFDEGIYFRTSGGEKIINYPRQHIANARIKHKNTNSLYKPMVRILKNIKSNLITNSIITNKVAPSYFIEGLFYNVPDNKFSTSYSDSFVNCINWIADEADSGKFICVNENYYLIRDASPYCWNKADYKLFLDGMIDYWNQW